MQPQQVSKKRVRLTKQDPREKKLEGKTFYLDNLKKCQSTLIWENIHALGGKVESFLHRDVNFVVTGSKEDFESPRPEGSKGGAKTINEEVQKTSKQQERVLSNDKVKQRPVTPRPVACGSRGKALLEKAIRNNEHLQESSVLSNARSWGVKIMYVDDAFSYLKQLSQEASTAKQKPSDIKARTLKAPFLKIEDLSRKYKPLFMLCVSLPTLSYRSRYSPFEPPPPPLFWDEKGTEKEQNKARENKVESIFSDKCQAPPSFEPVPRLLRKKDGSYCEICRQSFTSMEEHLQSDQHRSFVLDPSNYALVDGLVAEMLPGFDPNPPEQQEESVNRSPFLNFSEVEFFADAEEEEEHAVRVLLEQNSSFITGSAMDPLSSSSSPEAQVTTADLHSFAAEPDFQHENINAESQVMPVLHIEPQAQEAHQQQAETELLPLCPSSPPPLPDLYLLPPVLSPQTPFSMELSNPYSDPPVLSPQQFTFIPIDPSSSLVSVVEVKELKQDQQRSQTASGHTHRKRCRSASPDGGDMKRTRTVSFRSSSCPAVPSATCIKALKDNMTEVHDHALIQTYALPNVPSSPNTRSQRTCITFETVASNNSHTLNLNNSDLTIEKASLSTQCPTTSVCIEAALIPATTSMVSSSSDSDWDCELLSWLGSTASTTPQMPSEHNSKMDKELLHRPCKPMRDTSYESHLHTVLRPLTSTGPRVEDNDSLSFSRTSAQIVK
ncbi:protein DBF4 homolog A [Gouania willdenowi]|uniref:Protein DBF4 homolog A-like n=1 Tax=Gouania willdenowi TaxID=441366 RepID=A0A8C5GCH5_GOUWI|nr:protein DBF4 homolog A-like [Gouania willdenowi]